VLRKVYFDNARKLLARALPPPVLKARRISQDLELAQRLDSPLWQTAPPVELDQSSTDGQAHPEVATDVRALWSEKNLYLQYQCRYTKLTVFEPAQTEGKRFDGTRPGVSLWDRDVVEAFIGAEGSNIRRYAEFEVAPTNERLDLMIVDLPEKDFSWNSNFDSRTKIDETGGIWTCEMRIPLKALGAIAPGVGTRWRINLYRCDRAQAAFLAFRPTLTGSFHTPERFGTLEFVE
jgi:hypothetical protein